MERTLNTEPAACLRTIIDLRISAPLIQPQVLKLPPSTISHFNSSQTTRCPLNQPGIAHLARYVSSPVRETCRPEFQPNPQASKRHHPYYNAEQLQTHYRPSQSRTESSPAPPPLPAPNHSLTSSEATVRETFLEVIREKYPHFKARTDFDIYTLASTEYKGPPSGLYTWLDGQLALRLAASGDFDTVMSMTRQLLDSRGMITGVSKRPILFRDCRLTGIQRKPKLDAPNVFLRPIPNSQYSVRLFPGSLARQEFCMDFVLTSTGQAINSPFTFELWILPNASTPWLGGLPMRIHSLERMRGCREADISPGAEKFLLRDGQTCLLTRPGHRDLRFIVPIRAAVLQPADRNIDHLHFPAMI